MANTVHYDPTPSAIGPPTNDRRTSRAAGSPPRRLSPNAGDSASTTRPRPLSGQSWRLTTAVLACALIAVGHGPAGAAGPFTELDGSWSGSGRILLSDGKSEGLRCRAYYTPKGGGAEIGVALRCASASNKVEMRAILVAAGSRVSGSWEARTFNASGTVTGQASPTQIKLAINGGGLSGHLTVMTTGKRQVIFVSTEGVALKGVSVNLQREGD
jgi:hypothetical protein